MQHKLTLRCHNFLCGCFHQLQNWVVLLSRQWYILYYHRSTLLLPLGERLLLVVVEWKREVNWSIGIEGTWLYTTGNIMVTVLGFCLYPINPGRFSNQYRTGADRCTLLGFVCPGSYTRHPNSRESISTTGDIRWWCFTLLGMGE